MSIRRFLLGSPRNPLNTDTQKHLVLIALLAWVGLGADGLSSSCYGPEEAFRALGNYTPLSLYVVIATIATVFIISLAYNQVIELFPSGGGGYKVATQLVSKRAGLLSGAALIVDFVLTIAISIASGADAIFSFFPLLLKYKLIAEVGVIVLLILINLRGIKESILILLPIFLGFVVVHTILIIYGVYLQSSVLTKVVVNTHQTTMHLSQQFGWFFVMALFLRSYSLGSGTYTGIEAVSNNVNRLAEPKVKTGKWTMLYMAVSLSFTAGGFLLLYLIWNVSPVPGHTLNAIVFQKILGTTPTAHIVLFITLLLETCLLFVAANTGFLAGPNVLANMAIDKWVPTRFSHLSSRLVTQNGVILFGVAALIILLASQGHVAWLVVLYSMNVFLTFSISILGLCIYWWTHKKQASKYWLGRFTFSLFAFVITTAILILTLLSKFSQGGWVTIIITGAVIGLCQITRKYYDKIDNKLAATDILLNIHSDTKPITPPPLDPSQPTAIILISEHRGVGVHTLLWVLRMFPNHFKNFIFISAGIVDVESFRGKEELVAMQREVTARLNYFVSYCQHRGLAASSYATYGTDITAQLTELAEKVGQKYINSIFFASKLTFEHDNWLTRILHNETAYTLQRRLHLHNLHLVILPMRIG